MNFFYRNDWPFSMCMCITCGILYIAHFTNKGCGPSHYALHSFSNGLDQFHYNNIIMTFCST
jgi:hypothetical protein